METRPDSIAILLIGNNNLKDFDKELDRQLFVINFLQRHHLLRTGPGDNLKTRGTETEWIAFQYETVSLKGLSDTVLVFNRSTPQSKIRTVTIWLGHTSKNFDMKGSYLRKLLNSAPAKILSLMMPELQIRWKTK